MSIKYSPSYGELSELYLKSMDELKRITALILEVRSELPPSVAEKFEILYKQILEE